jgi:peptidoglycan/xylan/chitin deacetylase (PgdA/CDA1 family)
VQRSDRLLVLTWHAVDERESVISVSPAVLREQVRALAQRGFRGISLAQAYAERETAGAFPARSAVLTFDDGYRSVNRHALPTLASSGFAATVFLASGLVGLPAREAAARNPDLDRDILDWAQAAELLEAGWEIGSHTVTHPDLSRLDEAALERELGDSKTELEQRLQRPVRSLAYPYGRLNRRVRDAAARHYDHACTTRLALYAGGDPLRIDRIDMFYMQDELRFGKLLDGKLDAWLRLRRSLRAARSLLN